MKKIIGIIATILLLSLFPIVSYAEEVATETNTAENTYDYVYTDTIRVYQYYCIGDLLYESFGDDAYTDVKYSSNNTKVATVDSSGTVTAKAIGDVSIIAEYKGETGVWNLTVLKNLAKPVAMKKLQCYKEYSKKMTKAQFKKAYNAAWKLVRPYADLSRTEKIYGVTNEIGYLCWNKATYTSKAKHYSDPYGLLIQDVYTCAGSTRTTILCLNILGIKAKHINANKYTHQWATCTVNGKTWIVDAMGMYAGPKSSAPDVYRGKNYD